MTQEQKKVVGLEAVKKMEEKMSNRVNPSSQQRKPYDAIDEARRVSRGLIADRIVEAQLAKAEADVAEAKARADKAREGTGEKKKDDNEGFKITGHLDVFQMLTQQSKDREELRKEAERQAEEQGMVNADLRERLHQKELDLISTAFDARVASLQDTIAKFAESNSSKGSIIDQFNSIKTLAEQLGYIAPGAVSSDTQLTLKLEEMKFNQTMTLKEFERSEKRADREFNLQLRKFEAEAKQREEEREAQKKRDEMFASLPALIGGALAEGIKDQPDIVEHISEKPVRKQPAAKGQPRQKIQANDGEAGEIECPMCGEFIGIGPSSTQAKCTCGETYQIERISYEGEE